MPGAAFSARLVLKEPRMNQPLCILLVAAVVLLAGCVEPPAPPAAATTDSTAAKTAPSATAPAMFVLATGTVYYAGDPLHGHKPDGTFRRGTKVSLVHRAGNYSVVRSEDGIEAYVATHTLEPLAMQ
jgi:hypothetical protein